MKFLPAVLGLWMATVAAETPPTTGDASADAVLLKRALLELHPGLFRYLTPAEFEVNCAKLERALAGHPTRAAAFRALSEFTATVRCGHTQPNFFNQKRAVAAELFQHQDRLPFYFRWLDRRMVVTTDFTPQKKLPRGTEITAINGVPVKEILARLLTVTRADGHNDAKRIAQLEVTGDSVYEIFDVYFPLYFPMLGIDYTLTTSAGETIKAKALTYEERIAPVRAREADRTGGGDAALFEFKWLAPDDVVYLRMPTWALYNSKWDWKTWLNSRLDEVVAKEGAHLIVDLRGNEGGEDVGDLILERLVKSGTREGETKRLVRYRKVPDDLAPFCDTWDPSFKDWGAAARELAEPWPTAPHGVKYFAIARDADEETGGAIIRPRGKPLRGKLVVLVDATNSSATFQFAQFVQAHRLGTLMGTPTGGSKRGINGGAFFFFRLPQTQLEVDIPLIGNFPATMQPDEGLTPDALMEETVEDIQAGRDATLARARAWLLTQKPGPP